MTADCHLGLYVSATSIILTGDVRRLPVSSVFTSICHVVHFCWWTTCCRHHNSRWINLVRCKIW